MASRAGLSIVKLDGSVAGGSDSINVIRARSPGSALKLTLSREAAWATWLNRPAPIASNNRPMVFFKFIFIVLNLHV